MPLLVNDTDYYYSLYNNYNSAISAWHRRTFNLFAPDNYLSRPPYDMKNGIRSMICFCGHTNQRSSTALELKDDELYEVISGNHNVHNALLNGLNGLDRVNYPFETIEEYRSPENENSFLTDYCITSCACLPCVSLGCYTYSYSLLMHPAPPAVPDLNIIKTKYAVFLRPPHKNYTDGCDFYSNIRKKVNDMIHWRFYGNHNRKQDIIIHIKYITFAVYALWGSFYR